jgi:hypothetical protein
VRRTALRGDHGSDPRRAKPTPASDDAAGKIRGILSGFAARRRFPSRRLRFRL